MTLREIEKAAVLSALKQCQWRRSEAARVLGITSRTLQTRIAEYRREGVEIRSWRQRRQIVPCETENFSPTNGDGNARGSHAEGN